MLENNIAVEREKIVHRALIEFESALIGYAASIVKDEDRAKDVVQDTFIKLYEQDPEKVKESLKAWLFTVCRNRCFDVIRKEKRMINVEDDQLTVIRDVRMTLHEPLNGRMSITMLLSFWIDCHKINVK